jgi:hypothetical protein
LETLESEDGVVTLKLVRATPVQLTGWILALALQALPAAAQLCPEWAKAAPVGMLPPQLRESSGIAASRAYPGRLYHINDSGDAGRFYISELDGSNPQAVPIVGFRPRDTEALSLGPCPPPSRRSCLWVGDIGDNQRRRKTIEIVAVEEAQRFDASVNAAARITLSYPDGAHDAESMAVHPDGSVFILAKEHPANLFRWKLGSPLQTLEHLRVVDVGSPPTDMTLSDDGTRLIVLTYKGAVEFAMDFRERRTIPLLSLLQQESMTYLPGGRSFLFTTERTFPAQPQPLMRQDCVPLQ